MQYTTEHAARLAALIEREQGNASQRIADDAKALRIRKLLARATPAQNVTTGELYGTLSDAADSIGMARSSFMVYFYAKIPDPKTRSQWRRVPKAEYAAILRRQNT